MSVDMTIDEARKYLAVHCNQTYEHYINFQLAGDFAVEIATSHKRILTRLEAEIGRQWNECND